MVEISYRSDFDVSYIQHMGSDEIICQAARVSAKALAAQDTEESERLIKFLADNHHGTPFEHTAMTFMVTEPIFVTREFHRHRIGFCVAGSTVVPVGKNKYKKTIANIYRDWYEGVPDILGREPRFLASAQHLETYTANLDTGLLESTKMVDVYQSGVKDLLSITISTGHTLRCTPEHQIWTDSGWKSAGDLSVGNFVGRQGKIVVGEPIGIPHRLREGIQFWTSEQKAILVGKESTCYACKEVFLAEDLELDHIIPVAANLSKALDVLNLAPLCVSCHRKKTNSEQILARRRPQKQGIRFDQVISIVRAGREMTYDIEMPGPYHNFIANKFIVHNSYNEESSRWRQMDPVFYVPPFERPMTQIGRTGEYKFKASDADIVKQAQQEITANAEESYARYVYLLDLGVAKEIARQLLPVNLYTSFFATCNARSLMHFLSLRMDETALWEIRQVANQAFAHFEKLFPLTAHAFVEAGRRAV